MTMSDPFALPSPPDPTRVNQWAGQIRTFVALLAGMGIIGGAWAGVSAEQIANLLTALLTFVGLAGWAWASVKSWRAHAAERAIAVASAVASVEHGQPVVVTVTPKGQDNIATKVSATEAAAAPSVPMDVQPSPAPPAP